jgi:hypothetical protein
MSAIRCRTGAPSPPSRHRPAPERVGHSPRRHRDRIVVHLPRPGQHADPGPARRQWPDLGALAHHGAVFADAVAFPDRTQPRPQRVRLDLGGGAVFAAFSEYTDAQIGRVIDYQEESVVNGVEQRPPSGVSDALRLRRRLGADDQRNPVLRDARPAWHLAPRLEGRHRARPISGTSNSDEDRWQLFHTDEDRSEAHESGR